MDINHKNIKCNKMDIKIEFPQIDEDVDSPDLLEASALEQIKREFEVKTEPVEWKCLTCNENFTCDLALRIHEMLHSKTHYCIVCKKTISRNFDRHVKTQHSDIVCKICNKVFNVRKSLRIHERSHTKERIFKCDKCSKAYMQRGTLRSHVKTTHEGIKPFGCKICPGTFTTSSSLNKHVRRMHRKDELYECRICLEQFPDRKTRNDHEASHLRTTVCKICTQHFSNKDSYIKHLKTKHFKTEKCIYCDKIFHKSMLDRHVLIIHKPRTCNFCNEIFYSAREFTFHLNSHKEKQRCNICKRNYAVENLERHLQMHRDNKVTKCNICQSMCLDIDKHNSIVHNNTRFICCHLCPKKFLSKSGRIHHMLNEHVKEIKKYRCSTCGKLMTSVVALMRHQAMHSNIYPYKCLLCDRVFKYPDTLEKHEFQHHHIQRLTKEYKFKCKPCGRKFSIEQIFKSHKCLGMTPSYKCILCEFTYKNRSYFKKHLITHHSPTILSEEDCNIKKDNVNNSVKTLRCKNCRTFFKSSHSFIKHLCTKRYKTGFQCSLCHTNCVSKTELTNHIKQTHSAKKRRCKICGFKTVSLFCMRSHYVQMHILNQNTVTNLAEGSESDDSDDNKIDSKQIKIEEPTLMSY